MRKRTTQQRGRRAFLAQAGVAAAGAFVSTPNAEAQSDARASYSVRDLAIWATWYDLPVAGRNDYLEWAHKTYIPGLLKRPGYLWAAHYTTIPDPLTDSQTHTADPAVPAGNAFILVVGGQDANIFGAPTADELHASLSPDNRKMLAMRSGERMNIFTEASRITGPAAKDYKDGMTLAPCIQFGTYNVEYRKEIDILAWYSQSYLPGMTKHPGCIRARKLASVAGWAKMGILYEYSSVEARNSGGGGGTGKWEAAVRALIHAPGSPNIARRIWPEA